MKIIKCILPLMICAALASCGADDNSSVSTTDDTTAEVSTIAETSAQTEVEVNSEETDEMAQLTVLDKNERFADY